MNASRVILCAILASSLVGALAQPCTGCGTTVVPPLGTMNTIWTLAGSPWCVTSTISIQNVIIEAGVVVRVAPGATLQINGGVQAQGEPGAPVIFQPCDPTQGWDGILFSASPGTSNLNYCRIEGAKNRGLRILNSTPAIQNCEIVNCSASTGGGIYATVTTGNLVLTGCVVRDNYASGDQGGGIWASVASGRQLVLNACAIIDNSTATSVNHTRRGGGLYITGGGNLMMKSCRVDDNECRSEGGGCGAHGRGYGGGIYCAGPNLTMSGCAVWSNYAGGRDLSSAGCSGEHGYARGGGIYFDSSAGILTMLNCIVSGNRSRGTGSSSIDEGDGVHIQSGTAAIENCTVARNYSDGIHNKGTLTVCNSIVHSNGTPPGGVQIGGPGTVTVEFSDIQGGGFSGTGNIDASPLFVGIGSEAHHLVIQPPSLFTSGSPCIDAGDPNPIYDDGCFPPAQGTALNDMGAYGGPGVCQITPPALAYCTGRPYGQWAGGLNSLVLDWTPNAASTPPATVPVTQGVLGMSGAVPGAPGVLAISVAPVEVSAAGLTVLVDITPPLALFVPIPFDASGTLNAPMNISVPTAVGFPIYLQAAQLSPLALSNGLEMLLCY